MAVHTAKPDIGVETEKQKPTVGEPLPDKRQGQPMLDWIAPQPAMWNTLFYAVLGISILIGLLSLLGGSSITDAILRFLIAMLALSFLSIFFLSSIVLPFYARQYELRLERQKEEEAERKAAQRARARARFQDDEPPAELSRASTSPSGENSESMPSTGEQGAKPAPSASTPSHPEDRSSVVEDQASGLRRMVTSTS